MTSTSRRLQILLSSTEEVVAVEEEEHGSVFVFFVYLPRCTYVVYAASRHQNTDVQPAKLDSK